jgi:hypothetical protein
MAKKTPAVSQQVATAAAKSRPSPPASRPSRLAEGHHVKVTPNHIPGENNFQNALVSKAQKS